jgi:hypothetical protein
MELLSFALDKRKHELPSEFVVRLSVDFPAVTYLHNQHEQNIVFHSVDYPVIPYADTVPQVRDHSQPASAVLPD